MGWWGTAILGAVIGVAGWRFHPSAPVMRGSGTWVATFAAALIAALAAVAAKFAGNLSGAFSDGQSLEWAATVFAAIAAVAVFGRIRARRARV